MHDGINSIYKQAFRYCKGLRKHLLQLILHGAMSAATGFQSRWYRSILLQSDANADDNPTTTASINSINIHLHYI